MSEDIPQEAYIILIPHLLPHNLPEVGVCIIERGRSGKERGKIAFISKTELSNRVHRRKEKRKKAIVITWEEDVVKLACVSVVASAMANGTLTIRASVFASNVLPIRDSTKWRLSIMINSCNHKYHQYLSYHITPNSDTYTQRHSPYPVKRGYWRSDVIPEPVGPMSMTLLFSGSTRSFSFSSVCWCAQDRVWLREARLILL